MPPGYVHIPRESQIAKPYHLWQVTHRIAGSLNVASAMQESSPAAAHELHCPGQGFLGEPGDIRASPLILQGENLPLPEKRVKPTNSQSASSLIFSLALSPSFGIFGMDELRAWLRIVRL